MNKIEITKDDETIVSATTEGSIEINDVKYYIWCGDLYLNFYANEGYANNVEFTIKDENDE